MKPCKQIFLQLVLVFCVFSVAVLFFILFVRSNIIPFIGFEFLLFRQAYESSRYLFPNFFVINAIVISVLLLVGVVTVFYYLLLPLVKMFFYKIKTNHSKYGGIVIFVALTSLIVLILVVFELRYRHLNYFAGSCYPGNNFTEKNPEVCHRTMADERGMTYFNPVAFPITDNQSLFMVNKQGFPTMFDFDTNTIDSLARVGDKRKRKILFLGDSFLEGVGASTHDKSFIEIFRRNNPQILMAITGIGGMDPVQYRLVAEKYAPVIKPDEICVMFCGWNDVIWLDRKPIPFLPVFSELKNVGVISNYLSQGISPDGVLALPTSQAYHLYRNRYSLMNKNDILSKVCRQSNVTTQLYYLINPVKYYSFKYPTDSFATYRNLKIVKAMADSVGAKLSIIFIPTPPMKNYKSADYEANFKWAFKDLWPYVRLCPPGTIEEGDCSTSIDFHFNDKGQAKFAEFLQNDFSRKWQSN